MSRSLLANHHGLHQNARPVLSSIAPRIIHPVYRHPYFDLYLHDDQELGALLNNPVHQRQTLQEWPLSCVQRITTEDGRNFIYKVQHSPTVEPEFYARARSGLLISAQTLSLSEPYSAMLLDLIKGPTLEQMGMQEPFVLEFGWELLRRIACIEGQLPYHLDISTEAKWRSYISKILEDLHGLVEAGEYKLVQPEALTRLERWAFCDPVLATFQAGTGLVHHDLAGDNVFVLPDGPRVIDWQRPILGPTRLDLALLLESLGFEATPHVGEGVVWLMRLLRVSWFTECSLRWFPEGREGYDRQIADLIKDIGRG